MDTLKNPVKLKGHLIEYHVNEDPAFHRNSITMTILVAEGDPREVANRGILDIHRAHPDIDIEMTIDNWRSE